MNGLDDFDLNVQNMDDDNPTGGPEALGLSAILTWSLLSLTLVSEGWSNGAATNTTEYKC